jgi:lipopolysaccharide transport system permease protein
MAQTSLAQNVKEEIVYIRPPQGWLGLNLKDLWLYRELIYFLIWRDVKVRYKQTVLGASWAIIQPLMTMVVFTVLFGRVAKVPTDGMPYPIFSYTALLPWGLFTKALSDAGRSLIANRSMITKVYFPRLVIPISSVVSGIVDNSDLGGNYNITPNYAVITLPLFILLAMITSLGVGLWLSALNVIYRDVNYILPFITQIWLFITPVAYPASMIPEKWQLVYALNPMTGVVEGFRWALLGMEPAPGPMVAVSTVISVIVLITGLFYFRRMERTFADLV